jgi:hypothetical protein
MTAEGGGVGVCDVSVLVTPAAPDATQLAAWHRLWGILLAHEPPTFAEVTVVGEPAQQKQGRGP